jgi:hypothetical protein
MGWKAFAVIVNTIDEENDFEEILGAIGYRELEKIDDLSVDGAIYPGKNTVYIGLYRGNLIITALDLPLYFIDKRTNEIERRVVGLFRDTEICALSLQSVTNHWAFTVIDRGKKIRIKAGNIDQGTVFDIGEPLEQELELLSKSKLNGAGQREYFLENSKQPYEEHQVGENFVFELFKRYTGKRLDDDDELENNLLFGYRFGRFSGPSLYDLGFCGDWAGQSTYGEGYKDIIKGRQETFVLSLELENGQISGVSKDGDKEPATIHGFLFEDFIGFIHQYPVRYTMNEKGETVADPSQPGQEISYSGLYDKKTNSFRGIWRIAGRNNWGEWFMKRP